MSVQRSVYLFRLNLSHFHDNSAAWRMQESEKIRDSTMDESEKQLARQV